MPWPTANKVANVSTGETTDLNWVYAWGGRQIYWIDDFGADPTGQAASDSAWSSAYAAATAAVQSPANTQGATSGALVGLGRGVYTFSVGTVVVSDTRIGLVGHGKSQTVLRTVTGGASGDLVRVYDNSGSGDGGAPVGGFRLHGFSSNPGVNGLHYGDRDFGKVFDIDAQGFQGTGSRGFYFHDTTQNMEGSTVTGLHAANNTVGYCFDGNNTNGSFDYSLYDLHASGNGTTLQVINQAHLYGAQLSLRGNVGGYSAADTMVQVGVNTSDSAKLSRCQLHIAMEADNGGTSPTINDFVIAGNSNSTGIQGCYGIIGLLNLSGTFNGGSVSGSAVFQFDGPISAACYLIGHTGGNTTQLNATVTGFDSSNSVNRLDGIGAINWAPDSVQALSSSGTIKVATDGMYGLIPVTETGNVTGMILETPTRTNSTVKIINRSAFTITFAASGTSHVADGTSDVIAASSAATYTYDNGTTLWYRG
jgi:hypothetical protein